MLESTTKFTGERYEMGMLWSELEPKLPNNYSLGLGQLYSMVRRFQMDPTLKNSYQQSMYTDVKKGIRKDIGRVQNERHFRERMVFATPSSAKPEQVWQKRLVCNAASKYKEVCLNDKLLAEPDLLLGLI